MIKLEGYDPNDLMQGFDEFFSTIDKKRAGLAKSSAEKRAAHGKPVRETLDLNQGSSFGEGYSEINGNAVRNNQKLYNDLTGAELGLAKSYQHDQRIYNDESTGLKYQIDPATGQKLWLKNQDLDTSYLYGGDSKTDPNEYQR